MKRPKAAQHDFLVISIGGVAARAAHAGVLMDDLGVKLDDLACRIYWLGIDTDWLPAWGRRPGGNEVVVQHVRTADRRARLRADDYLQHLQRTDDSWDKLGGLLPEGLKVSDLQDDILVHDVTHGQAAANPLRGFWYMVVNLPHVLAQLEDLKAAMTAGDRTIVLLLSPCSGTAAGGWMLTLALIMRIFPDTPPILICVMPSQLQGRREHVQRNHAIFGWNGLLLERVVQPGLSADWAIPVEGRSRPIRISARHCQPAATYLIAHRRRKGDAHLASTDEVIRVLGQVLTLMMVGKDQGLGLPSAHSHILDLNTHALLDEAGHNSTTEPPKTRRFAALGLFTVRFSAGLAAKVARLKFRVAIANRLLEGGPVADGFGKIQRWPTDVVEDAFQCWWEKIREDADQATHEEIDGIDNRVEGFVEEMKAAVAGGDVACQLREKLWQRVRDAPRAGLTKLRDVLQNLSIDEGQVLEVYARYCDTPDRDFDAKPSDALKGIVTKLRRQEFEKKRSLAQLGESGLPGVRDNLRRDILEARLDAELISVTANELVPLLDRIRNECADGLRRIAERIKAVQRDDAGTVQRHRDIIDDRRYQIRDRYELAYPLADKWFDDHLPEADLAALAGDWVQSLESRDEALPDLVAVRSSLDRTFETIEGITDFASLNTTAVLEMLVKDADLLGIALDRGRALVAVQSQRYATHWSISHSAADSDDIRSACGRLEEAIRRALPNEDFGVTFNVGRIPLRDTKDVIVVFQEQVTDFSIHETVSDEEFTDYLKADKEEDKKHRFSVHRLHGGLLGSAGRGP